MTTATDKQAFAFQTEIKTLLHILSHSLYQNRDIAIRELVSNASDALDKIRHIQLTQDKYRDDVPLAITLVPNAETKTLTIQDNGIGLTKEELVANLGTIAHSGSLEFLQKLAESPEQSGGLSLIGQFGVGFYSAFMLADTVEVVTRSYLEDTGWRWESDGSGQFTIEAVTDELPRGTQVILRLKPDLEEFTEDYRLRQIVRKYSTFVPHPIKLGDEQLNEQRPIWVEPKSSLKEEDYVAFFQHLSHNSAAEPLWHLHLSSDSPLQFNAILYCPPTNFEALGMGRTEHGMHLCARRILVQDDCQKLVPEYLRFLYGLVDSADLPLNVSRETLQDDKLFAKIRKVLTKRALKHLDQLAKDEPEKYAEFYRQFGGILREGVSTDFENREAVAGLLRFTSSKDETLTSLDAYCERAGEEQKQIYFVCGPELSMIKKNPHLELFRKRGVEVLYLDDPVDEYVLTNLRRYQDREIVPVDSAEVQFPEKTGEDQPKETETQTEPPAGFSALLTLFKEALDKQVEDVRESKRLSDSPCCLVNPSGAMSTQLQKLLQLNNPEFELSRRILEVNPQSPFIQRLCRLTANASHTAFIKECGRQLYANAALLEGLDSSPEQMVQRMQQFMEELADKRSPIITD